MNVLKLRTTLGVTVVAALSLFASTASAESLVAINSNNQISVFDSGNTLGAVFNPIIGAAAGKTFIGIDLRPSNNTVYGITTSNEIFTLDAYTGNSSFVAVLSSNVINGNFGYGLDFNPTVDSGTGASLRLVSSNGDNYAVNVNTGASAGAVGVQGNIAKGFTGVSYTNSNASTPTVIPASTTLYYIDSTNDTLSYANAPFSTPSITTIGALEHDIVKANGFDVLSNGTAFSAFLMDGGTGKTILANINLSTGAATKVGDFAATINGLTIAPVPEPETYAMLIAGLGLIGAASRRKNKKA